MNKKKKLHANCSGCPIAHALDVLGDRWTLLLLRQIMIEGQHEYKEFLQMPEAIATNVLSDRLSKLLEVNILGVLPHPTNKTRKLYYATEKGIALVPLLKEVALWSAMHSEALPAHPKIETFKNSHEQFVNHITQNIRSWNASHGV